MKKEKTIAEQLGIRKFPFIINNDNGQNIYFENRKKYWVKMTYDKNGNEIKRECSDFYVGISKFNENNQLISYGDSKGYWQKREYDSNGIQNYYANAHGVIDDNRNSKPIQLTITFTLK